MKYESKYLQHHGIEGQQWGVRRFQNEDGTLTPEGRERYLKKYSEAEKDAERRVNQAKGQLEDLKKNGWNAKSVFAPGVVESYAEELGVKPKDLPKEELNELLNIYMHDLAIAQVDLESARDAKDFVKKNNNVTYDQILEETSRIDSQSSSSSVIKRNEEAKRLADEMGLETKKKDDDTVSLILELDDYSPRIEKKIKNRFPDVMSANKEMYDILHDTKMDQYINIADLKKKSEYEQCWALLSLLSAMFGTNPNDLI